jgi:HD superfamily phosphohydrolase
VPAIEHYLFGRHQAYKMALHSLDKSAESLVKKVLHRFQWAYQQGLYTGRLPKELYQLMTDGHQLSVDGYLRMDDCYLWESMTEWADHSEDPLLSQLANRVLRHDLFKFVNLSKYDFAGRSLQELTSVYDALKKHYQERALSFEFCFDETIVNAKPMYQPTDVREPIWILTRRGRVIDLQEASSFSLSLNPDGNMKHLLFVWDKTALNVLTQALERHNATVGKFSVEALDEENHDVL